MKVIRRSAVSEHYSVHQTYVFLTPAVWRTGKLTLDVQQQHTFLNACVKVIFFFLCTCRGKEKSKIFT